MGNGQLRAPPGIYRKTAVCRQKDQHKSEKADEVVMVQIVGEPDQLTIGESQEENHRRLPVKPAEHDHGRACRNKAVKAVHSSPAQSLYPFKPIEFEEELRLNVQPFYPSTQHKPKRPNHTIQQYRHSGHNLFAGIALRFWYSHRCFFPDLHRRYQQPALS